MPRLALVDEVRHASRTEVALDRHLIELHKRQTLRMPVAQRAPFDRYTVHLMRAWDDNDIDIAIPTDHLISSDGFSQARSIRALYHDRDRYGCEIEVQASDGHNRYRFSSRHRRAVAALQGRIDALAPRARRWRQARLDQALAATPAALPSPPTLQIDPEMRIDVRQLSRRTTSGSLELVFARSAEPAQIVDIFGPLDGWREGAHPRLGIDLDDTLAGQVRYAIAWHGEVTTTLLVDTGSRAASNFHHYITQLAGDDDIAPAIASLSIAPLSIAPLSIAVQELSGNELAQAIARLQGETRAAREHGALEVVTDEVWAHVLERRQVPRDLVYPAPDRPHPQPRWPRLCDEALASQRVYQFCNDWFLQHALPRLALASFNQVIDLAGQDRRTYLQRIPPLLRRLEVPFSGLDQQQVMQACRSLRNAWLSAPAEALTPALRRCRLLRGSTLRQALAERGAVKIDWLLPAPDRHASTDPGWRTIIVSALQAAPEQHDPQAPRHRIMQWRHVLWAAYPDYPQLQRAQLKSLLRAQGVQSSLDGLALIEFEPDDTLRQGAPARALFIDTLLQDGLPDALSPHAGVYHVQAQQGQLTRDATSLTPATLQRLLTQADTSARQLHHAALRQYWRKHGAVQSGGDDSHAMMLSAQACLAAHDLWQAGCLSGPGLRLITAAAGFGTADTDEFECHLLDLGGVVAIDLVTLRGGHAGVILYCPGQWPPWRQYADMTALRQAIADDCADDTARRRWASHFDPAALPDSFKAGVDSLLWRLGYGEAIAEVALAEGWVRIEGDVFHQVARRRQQADEHARPMNAALPASPWSDDARFFDDDLGLSTADAPGCWMDALVLALNRHAQSGPAWEADSRIVATPAQGVAGLPAVLQQDLLQAVSRQEQEQALWHQRAPDLGIDGAQYMRDFLCRTFPERFGGDAGAPDLDRLVLNEYHPPQSHVAFYMFNRIDLLRRRKSSIPLSELSYRNIDIVNAWESMINGGERYFTVSHQDTAPTYYDEQFDNLVDPVTLVRALIDGTAFDFAAHHQQQIATYFTAHGTTLARLARERALLAARLMMHEGRLSNDDYRLAAAAFGRSPESAADVTVYPLRVAGHCARDSLHLHCRSSGRRLLYLAGDDSPYLAFDHLPAARQFLLDLGRDPQGLADFAHTHFAREDADDRRAAGGLRLTLVPGVISTLRTIDQASRLNAAPPLALEPPKSRHDAIVRRRSLERLHGLLDQSAPLGGDPFLALMAISQQGAMADAAYFIRSASDRAKEEWMEYARIIPVDFVEGLVKLAVGKTADDLRSARLSLGKDLILNLIPSLIPSPIPTPIKIRRTANPVIAVPGSRSARALLRTASRDEPVAKLARWLKPPQRINGKLGYPLSPSRPHWWHRAEHKLASTLLDMRAFNATRYDAQAILHAPVPRRSPRWYTVAAQAIRLDRAASAFLQDFVPPPRPYLGQLGNIDDLFELAYHAAPAHGYGGLGRGLVVGENHATTAARRFLDDHLERLADSGVKTLYTEVFKRDADHDLLRIFNAGGDFPHHVVVRLRNLDAHATPRSFAEFADGRPSASLVTLFDNARRHGLEVRAIDNVTAAAPNYLRQQFISPHPRTSSMNYVAYQIIRHDQAHSRRHAWVAHVGAGHAIRDNGIAGINELTATPSLFVYGNKDPVPFSLGDYHLAVDADVASAALQWQSTSP